MSGKAILGPIRRLIGKDGFHSPAAEKTVRRGTRVYDPRPSAARGPAEAVAESAHHDTVSAQSKRLTHPPHRPAKDMDPGGLAVRRALPAVPSLVPAPVPLRRFRTGSLVRRRPG